MVPVWKLRFWTEHFLELVPTSKVAVPIAVLWSFLERMWVGTVDAVAFSPVLLGISVAAITLDTITGSYKALTNPEAEVFSSATFGRVIDKCLKYVAVVVAFSLIAGQSEPSLSTTRSVPSA